MDTAKWAHTHLRNSSTAGTPWRISAGRSTTSPPIVAAFEDEMKFYKGDISDPIDVYDAAVDFDPDRILHLSTWHTAAAEADLFGGIHVNVLGSMYLLEAAASCDVDRVVAGSSMSVYGGIDIADQESIDETIPRQPADMYGLGKYASKRSE